MATFEQLLEQLKRLSETLNSLSKEPRVMLLSSGQKCIGQILSPQETELGCAISVDEVHRRAFGKKIGGDGSTARMYDVIRKDPTFKLVLDPLPGDIILSPTGSYGSIGHGHVGLLETFGRIMSNDSMTGRWSRNWTIDRWINFYKVNKGFPVYYFRKISL